MASSESSAELSARHDRPRAPRVDHPELELLLVGIGGQGIQLIGKTLAQAATDEGKHAMLAADYGGEMRGGPSNAAVVIGNRPLRALPVLPGAGSAIVAHHKFAGVVPERLRPGGLLLVNSSIVDDAALAAVVDRTAAHRLVAVPATAMAAELEAPQSGGFILLGAFNALARWVHPDSLVAAMTSLLPPYRRQHADRNAEALAAGAATVAGQIPAAPAETDEPPARTERTAATA